MTDQTPVENRQDTHVDRKNPIPKTKKQNKNVTFSLEG